MEMLRILKEEKVLDIDDADDVIGLIFVNGKTGIHVFFEQRFDIIVSIMYIGHDHINAGDHDIPGDRIRKFEHIMYHLAFFSLDHAVLMPHIHITQ